MDKKNIDKVFSIEEKNKIEPLPYRSFRKGLFGDSMEASLQKLLEKYPDIIPGTQIYPGKEDPPRFALLCREMSVSSWSLDFLLIDQYAVPTLIEAKLVENPESRRAVVGQIMEYAANSAEEWSEGKLREKAAKYWSKRGKDVEDVIATLTDEEDIESFWDEVEENLKQRKIRLIIATDKLRPEVRTIIEFLNTELENVEMLGLEINCYGQDEESVVVVPRIIGQTQATSKKTSSNKHSKLWKYSDLKEYYQNMENENRSDRLLKALEFAKRTDSLIESKLKYPSFGIKNHHDERIFTFQHTGKIYCYISEEKYDGEEERDEFIEKINQYSIFDYPIGNVVNGRDSEKVIEEMSDSEFEDFLELLEDYI